MEWACPNALVYNRWNPTQDERTTGHPNRCNLQDLYARITAIQLWSTSIEYASRLRRVFDLSLFLVRLTYNRREREGNRKWSHSATTLYRRNEMAKRIPVEYIERPRPRILCGRRLTQCSQIRPSGMPCLLCRSICTPLSICGHPHSFVRHIAPSEP